MTEDSPSGDHLATSVRPVGAGRQLAEERSLRSRMLLAARIPPLGGLLGGSYSGDAVAAAAVGHVLVEVHLKPELARGRRPQDALRLHRAFMKEGFRLVAKHVLPSSDDECCDLAELSYVHKDWLATMGPGTASELCGDAQQA